MPVTVILQFADQGWHVRWRTPDTEEFEATKQAFKDILSLRDHYWDPEAFNGKGGWWVAYGALESVGRQVDRARFARRPPRHVRPLAHGARQRHVRAHGSQPRLGELHGPRPGRSGG